MVSSLVEKCSQYMWKDLIPDNVCRALEFANLFEDSLLKVNILFKSASDTIKLSFEKKNAALDRREV